MSEGNASTSSDVPARQLTCACCGTSFGCDPSGACWCKAEAARLPMPVAGDDCLCPSCLRAAAAAAAMSPCGR